MVFRSSLILILLGYSLGLAAHPGDNLPADAAAAHRALLNLTEDPRMGITVPIADADFLFENLWWTWDPVAYDKVRISEMNEGDRRKQVFAHYGLVPNPKNSKLPLGLVKRNGFLAMNCLACHAGQVHGQTVIGLPNRSIDLRSLYHDIAQLNPAGGLVLLVASQSLGPERGLVATMGMEMMALDFRDKNMDLDLIPKTWGDFSSAVANAPPWWNINFKTHIMADAVLPITPRIFVTSASSVVEPGSSFRNYEGDVNDVFELAKTTVPPKYPLPIELDVAVRGKIAFDNNCAKCHGQYDLRGRLTNYPNKIVKLQNVGTDPFRVWPSPSYRKALDFLNASWVALDFQSKPNELKGYLAPPLLGIWSTAPYLHNGSVPTLWDLLNPDQRPKLWRQSEAPEDYDLKKIGLSYSAPAQISAIDRAINSRFSLYYDTQVRGRSAQGHDYPNDLTDVEKIEVLEFLKLL